MSEQTITEEQQVPTKEELINFFKEQIEVKKVQLELQELNTNLAVAKAEELKALGFIAQMTTQPGQKSSQPEGTPHTVTQDDLDNNPELVEAGVQVGDDVMIPTQPEEAPVKKLKKK
jgi:Na+-transporting NADH:ubiquinone oxidoreductase subunit NqrA